MHLKSRKTFQTKLLHTLIHISLHIFNEFSKYLVSIYFDELITLKKMEGTFLSSGKKMEKTVK